MNDAATPRPPDAHCPAIVVGASTGGVDALLRLAAALPAGLPAIIGIVLHVGMQPSILPRLLSRAGRLPAVHPVDGERLRPGVLYVAPPGRHMRFEDGVVRLTQDPPEHSSRPSIDALFRSVAQGWGARAAGVVLTGQLDDGTEGLAAIKAAGGVAVVQDPVEADSPSMPASALAHVQVDHCLRLDAIPALLVQLAHALPGDTPHLQASLRSMRGRETLLRRLANVAEAIGDPRQAHAGRREADRVQARGDDLVRLIETGGCGVSSPSTHAGPDG